ncbi:MAG: ABC transporter permease [Firmicutes bacterium]|nr:ABC transporter permease [Bacillota bacterium]
MYSLEHKKYLNRLRKNKILVITSQILLLISLIFLWELAAHFEWINTFVYSSPSNILKTIINLHNTNNLYQHIFTTVYETFISFSLATIIGIVIATILWWNNTLYKILDPFLTVLNSLPKVALGPIIIIWMGANIKSIIFMAILVSIIITIINVYQGFINTDNNKIKLLKSFGATKFQVLIKVIFPSNYSNIISMLKINVSMSLIGVIMGELLVSKQGIGYLIMYGSQIFNLSLVMSGIILLGLIATIMYYVVYYVEKLVIKN